MPQLDPEGVVVGTESLQGAAKTKVTQDNGNHCYKYYEPLLVSSKNSCFGNIFTEKEVAMEKVQAHIPQENELQRVEVGSDYISSSIQVPDEANATQPKGKYLLSVL